jgi:hypothetical protein
MDYYTQVDTKRFVAKCSIFTNLALIMNCGVSCEERYVR